MEDLYARENFCWEPVEDCKGRFGRNTNNSTSDAVSMLLLLTTLLNASLIPMLLQKLAEKISSGHCFISSSRPEPESSKSSNEVNQHGEALVIEIPHTKDVSSGFDFFESVSSQLLGIRDQFISNVELRAVMIKIIQPKSKISYDKLTTKLCPVLSIHKLYKLRTLYSHNSDDTNSVSLDVISKFKVLMSERTPMIPDSDSYLLDDNSSMAFPFIFTTLCLPLMLKLKNQLKHQKSWKDRLDERMAMLKESAAEDIENLAETLLNRQRQLLESQSSVLEALQTIATFLSQALEESRGTLRQLTELSHNQQQELIQSQEQLKQAHDHLGNSSGIAIH
nr:hypothetical protein [Tanacetum cinerariifolium]